MRKIAILSAAFCLSACARQPAIVTIPPASCHLLIPERWADGVDAAPVPANADISAWLGQPLTEQMAAAIQAPWVEAYNAQDTALASANGRTSDAVAIFANCEAQANAARAKK